MLQSIGLFSLMGERMRYLTERQSVIGRNIANADTPGFEAQDLAPFSVAPTSAASSETPGAAAPLVLVSTNAGHLAGTATTDTPFQVQTDPNNYGEKPDGNTVSLEEQMIKSADVANAFAMATAVYAKSIELVKIGIDNK